MPERKSQGPTRVRRCLYCFDGLPPLTGASVRCATCEVVNTRGHLELYLTRHSSWVRAEQILKAVISISAVAIFGLMVVITWTGGNDPRLLPFGGAGLCLTVWFLWETACHVTRREIAFDPSIAWPGLILAVGVLPLLFGLLFASSWLIQFGAVATAVVLIPAWVLRYGILALGRWRMAKYEGLIASAGRR